MERMPYSSTKFTNLLDDVKAESNLAPLFYQ